MYNLHVQAFELMGDPLFTSQAIFVFLLFYIVTNKKLEWYQAFNMLTYVDESNYKYKHNVFEKVIYLISKW